MTRTYSFTPLAAAAALLLSACGDDTERPRGNQGGSGGTTANNGGGGTTANGGSNTGNGGGGGGSNEPPPCTGCAEITMEANAVGILRMFQFGFGMTTQADLSTARITWRLRTLTTNDLITVQPFAQTVYTTPDPDEYPGVYEPQLILNEAAGFSATDENAWVNLTLDLDSYGETPPANPDAGTDAGDAGPAPVVDAGDAGDAAAANPFPFDKSLVVQTGIQFLTLPGFTGPVTVRVLVDSVTFDGVPDTGPTRDRDFATSLDGFEINPYDPNTTTAVGPTLHAE